jgi:UDP-N-acetylglucosamine diphosphorylase / glucose-1-phosphate thymidylyltransferase / UDP-N-acetylgalactosamine diphosphorylase / glucosamine-1-phosphate N-acetyltransferase / galactosamine-1-phosphate N-acetyltransferase
MPTICIFEGAGYERLHPLVYLRPTYDLRCGITTLRQKITRAYSGASVALHCRPYLAALVKEQNPGVPVNEVTGDSVLFIDGRVIADANLAQLIPLDGPDALYMNGTTVVAARMSGPALDRLRKKFPAVPGEKDFAGLQRQEVAVNTVAYPWDLVHANGEQIVADVAALTAGGGQKIKGKVYAGVQMLAPENIYIEEGASVKPGVVLDAEGGPIFIGKKAKIFPNAVIEGPAFIGEGSMIKIGAKIYENTSIGEVCKVGGEVEGSIIHAYSNKQHDGFLGHAYLAMWVNLGADTNNSDLKNNYGSVRVYINGKEVDSGSMFVGLTMGDHSKSGINTMFNTGTVVGVSSNVFGAGFPPKYVPSFSWGGAEGMVTYDIDKGLEVAKRVMERRKMQLSQAEEKVLREVFAMTKQERSSKPAKSRKKPASPTKKKKKR